MVKGFVVDGDFPKKEFHGVVILNTVGTEEPVFYDPIT